MRRFSATLLPTLFVAAVATGCVTEGTGTEATDSVAAETDASDADDGSGETPSSKPVPSAPPAEHPTPEPGPSGSDAPPMALGDLADDDAKEVVHEALATRLGKGRAKADGVEESIELGNLEAFRFTVVKVMVGKDDISGDLTQSPDGIDVEVTGWYKRTLVQSGSQKSTCFSFDTILPLARRPGTWVVPEDWAAALAREDEEDCF